MPIQFLGKTSTSGLNSKSLAYYWTFGDGGVSFEENPLYSFSNPGVYPITLVVDDGATRNSFTQHITIDGEKLNRPSFILTSHDEPSFRNRPLDVMDVYGSPVKLIPHSLRFLARSTRAKPDVKIITLENIGKGILPKANSPKIIYTKGSGWLVVEPFVNKDNSQALEIAVDATGLPTGLYSAIVTIDCPGASNSRQYFFVELNVPSYPPSDKEMGNTKQEIIDNEDIRYDRFYSTPYFWVWALVFKKMGKRKGLIN